MALLISKADFAGRIDISANLSDAKLNPQIQLAQDLDLAPLMGDSFYFNTLFVSENEPYLTLINGGVYTKDDIDINFEGLKTVLVYFTGARLIRKLDSHITPNAIMQKRNEFSDHVELKEKIFDANQLENIALAYWTKLINYIENEPSQFPLWKNNCGCTNKIGYRPRMTSVGYGR